MEIENPFDPFSAQGNGDRGLLEEIQRRHGNSSSVVSKQMMAITSAVLEVLSSQAIDPTPAALFAALLAMLDREETSKNPEVVAAVCNLVSLSVLRIPNAVLRDKCGPALRIFENIVLFHTGKAAPVKAALKCMGQFLPAIESMPELTGAFTTLFNSLCDHSTQVRKIALAGLKETLVAHRESPDAKLLYSYICETSASILAAPEQTAEIAASVPKKLRQEKEGDIKKAVLRSLHLLSGLKEIVPLMEGTRVMEICGAICRLFALNQNLLSVSACDVFKSLFSSPQQQVGTSALVKLLKVLVDEIACKYSVERELSCAMCGVLERGYCKLYSLDKTVCLSELPGVIHYLAQQLAAEHDGVRYASVQSLTSLLSTCLDQSTVSSEVASGLQNIQGPSPLISIVAAVSSTLGPRYQDAQAMALPGMQSQCSPDPEDTPNSGTAQIIGRKRLAMWYWGVVKSLIEKLGREGGQLATGLVEQLGVVCGALIEAEEEEESTNELRHYLQVGEATLGAAIKHLGPEVVLEVLPLNIIQALDGTSDEHRTWLLPLLKKHVESGSLEYWGTKLLPYARELGNRAAAASAGHQSQLASKCNALELQIWDSLPSFCSWCRDADVAFGKYVQFIGAAFNRRKDLRHSICQALVFLASQSRIVLMNAGETELCGFSSPPGVDEDEALSRIEEGLAVVPLHFTPELARRTLLALRSQSKEWLQALYNAFISTPASQRVAFFQAIAAYATISEPEVLANLFKVVLENLIKCVQGGDAAASVQIPGTSDPWETQCTFMDLVLSIAGGLDDVGIGHLYKFSLHTIEVKHPGIQKKGYKILRYIVNTRGTFVAPKWKEIVEKLQNGVVLCLPPAKRFRMHCLSSVLKHLCRIENPSLQEKETIQIFVGEILMCTKEQNKKAVEEAYKALVGLAEDAIEGPHEFLGFLNIVMTGLLSQMPRAISATVQGLSRLVHRFYGSVEPVADKLLKTVLTLVRAKSKEIDAAVLGFLNVCAMKYQINLLLQHLQEILDAILIWREDPKCKLRVKVRTVVMRLATRCGFDQVGKFIPENYATAFSHIRRTASKKERRKREGVSQLDGDAENDNMILGDEMTESEWGHSKFFTHSPGMDKTVITNQSMGRKSMARSKATLSNPFRFGQLVEGGDPLNMLDTITNRSLARAAAGIGGAEKDSKDDEEEEGPMKLPVNEHGKFLIDNKILEKEQKKENKRKRDLANDSDQDDDVRTHRSGATTKSGVSRRSKSTIRTNKTSQSKISSHYTGRRFKANRGAGGDLQGASKLEPFAYWKLDRNLLSRRRGKKAAGMRDLGRVVGKGNSKAKRFKRN